MPMASMRRIASITPSAVSQHSGVEQPSKSALVVGTFVDVRDSQLGLSEESMIGALEDLALFGDRADDYFERRAAVGVAERSRLDLANHFRQAAADGPEILEPVGPEKPASINAAGVGLPTFDEGNQRGNRSHRQWESRPKRCGRCHGRSDGHDSTRLLAEPPHHCRSDHRINPEA